MVVAARNDNYGGDFEVRLQNCVRWFVYYADKYQIKSEFIIVDYNPLTENKPLKEIIEFPNTATVMFRLITVPNAFHEKISDPIIRKKLPMYEYIAKNIGIRRAKGVFVLAANPDILMDPSIFEAITEGLNNSSYYRTDRADYPSGLKSVFPDGDLPKIRKAVFKMFVKGFQYAITSPGVSRFQLLFLRIKNNLRLRKELLLVRYKKLADKFSIPHNPDYIEFKIHSNCSGDFMLMHRDAWNTLHGYPENTYLAMHTDAIMVAMAKFSGLMEHVFFYPVYHQDHARRFVADNNNPDIFAMYRKFEVDAQEMEAQGKPKIYNDEKWGFPDEAFEEYIIQPIG